MIRKIDWTKPIENVDPMCRRMTYEYLGRISGGNGGRIVRISHHDNRRDLLFFDENGRSQDGSVHLRNVPGDPSAPEREPGWYMVKAHGWHYWLLTASGRWQTPHGLIEEQSGWRIGERVYMRDEWRPASKFPPPMDGTVFEVESESPQFENMEFMAAFDGAMLYWQPLEVPAQPWHLASWILYKRWRPVQS